METVSVTTDLWQEVLSFVETRIDEHVYDSWFRPIRCESVDPSTRRVRLKATAMTKDWVTLYYADLLDGALKALNLFDYKIDWAVDATERHDGVMAGELDPDFVPEMEAAAVQPVAAVARAAAGAAPSLSMASTTFVDIEPVENSINPKYTF